MGSCFSLSVCIIKLRNYLTVSNKFHIGAFYTARNRETVNFFVSVQHSFSLIQEDCGRTLFWSYIQLHIVDLV
jgi:hypothetical protein